MQAPDKVRNDPNLSTDFGLGVDEKVCANRIQHHNLRSDRLYFRRTLDQIWRNAIAGPLCFGLRQPVSALIITQADGEAIRRRK